MPAPNHDKWSDLRETITNQSEAAREQLRSWYEQVREEPRLIWETLAIRYTTYFLGGLILVFALRWAIGLLQPYDPEQFQPPARTALFDVVCANPNCHEHFVIERKFRFDRFPVDCPHCKQESGYLALRCGSDYCRGRLVQTVERDDVIYCAQCNSELGEK